MLPNQRPMAKQLCQISKLNVLLSKYPFQDTGKKSSFRDSSLDYSSIILQREDISISPPGKAKYQMFTMAKAS